MYLCVCPVVGFTRADTLANMNIPINDVPAEQAPTIAPPIRTDDQILPVRNWVPIGKSNCVLNILKPQKSPISQDTMCYDSTTGMYRCQLYEQWFNLYKEIIRDALQITPTNDNDPFVAPPLSDTVIKYVNTLGYPSTLKNVSAMSVNSLYQPWRAIFSMINMCLTGKIVGYDRQRHPVLQILWGIIHRSNIDYAERIWEEFIQSIQTFLTHKKNLTTAARVKKKSTPLLISRIRFTKLIIHYLKTKHNIYPRTNSPLHYSHDEIVLGTLRSVGKDGREIFSMPIPDALLTNEIKRGPYYGKYLEHVAKYQQYLDEEHGKAREEGVTESPKATKVTKPKAAKQIKPSAPKAAKALELSLKDQGERTQGPARSVVFREPDSRRFQPLPEVQDEAVTDLIHQDSSSVPPMTIPVIDLSLPHSVSIIVHAPLPTSTATTTTITTTTYLPPPPPQPQQSTSDLILLQCIGELDKHMVDLIQNNLALEERLDKHGSRLYNLENLNIPHKVSQAVNEIVIDAVDWAMQAPLRARFSDLPAVDMKEALEKSLECYYSNQLLSDLEEARRKKRKKRTSQRTPSRSLPSQPPPPPPSAGASGTPGTLGASRSSQLPPPPLPPSTGTSGSAQQQGSKALSSSKIMVSTLPSMAWTTSNTRFESAGVSAALELSLTDSLMNDDSILDEQVLLSDDEVTGNNHLPNTDIRKDWWKLLRKGKKIGGDYPHRALKNKELFDNDVPAHVTETRPNLAEFQDFNVPYAFWSYIRPFGCHVTILNTIDHLGKFAGKSDEGFLVGYSLQSKAFRVYNLETKRVEENLHINFLENKPNIAGKGPTWLFDLDYLTDSMNYHPVRSENQANHLAGQQEANQNAGTEDIIDAGDSETEDESAQDCFVLPIWPSYSSTITPDLKTDEKRDGPREEEQVFMDELERLKRQEKEANEEAESLRKKFETLVIQEGAAKPSSTNIFSTVSTPAKASSTNLVNTVSIPVSTASPHEGLSLSDPTNPEEDDSEIPPLEDIYQHSTEGIFTTSSYDDEGAVADFTNLETVVNVSPIPTSRIHSTHPKALILGDPNSAVQTRSKVNTSSGAHAFVSYVQKQRRNNHKDFQHCLFACFLSQQEPKKISEALEDESWVDAMQEELLQFEIQKFWVLVDLPYGKKAISTKWVYRNKTKTKHIAIRHHFIRDAYEKKLIQVLKIHTDDNVADLLTKAFDVSRFQFLVVSIGMINP
ncbi:hypothetical protein Tco_0060224 [Tanacetum coccineum]